MSKLLVSVIICTYNPRRTYLLRVLEALAAQTLPKDQWELILVDNASATPLASEFELSWHPHGIQVREAKQGLTAARLCGIAQASAECLVFVDDDNVLHPEYLQHAIDIFQANPKLAAIGGKSIPEFEIDPPNWFAQVELGMGCRDYGDEIETFYCPTRAVQHYPKCAPVGAGMVIRRIAIQQYCESIRQDAGRMGLGRTGKSLRSGEDCDMNLTLLSAGWGVGYFPQLQLTHLIPASRLNRDYLGRLNQAVMESWVQVLDTHGIRPWSKIAAWTIPIRRARSYLRFRAWQNPVAYIRWQGAYGMFLGRAQLSHNEELS
jgi:hypothetical protein